MMNNNPTTNTILLFTCNNIQGRGLQTTIEQQLGQPVLLAKGSSTDLPVYRDEHYVAIVDSSLPDLSGVKVVSSTSSITLMRPFWLMPNLIWASRVCSLGRT